MEQDVDDPALKWMCDFTAVVGWLVHSHFIFLNPINEGTVSPFVLPFLWPLNLIYFFDGKIEQKKQKRGDD